MKKSLLIAPILAFALFTVGMTPATSNAQTYYGNYSSYGVTPTQGCIDLTAYQSFGSTDAYTGGQVSELQIFLNRTGYLSGVSGTFDQGTYGAVVNFQRAYGIQPTGTVGPVTQAAINQQSCASGVGVTYPSTNVYSYPVTNYSNGSNCYWSGGTYNSTYVCTSAPLVPAPVIYPGSPVVCNSNNFNYNNGYNNSYNNGYNCNNNSVVLNSLSFNYTYNTTTITINGSGFTSTGNVVFFGNSQVAGVYSSNGSTLTFTVPAGYYSGTYSISVKNGLGVTSNSLSYAMNNGNNYNNGYNYNYYNNNNNGYNGCNNGYQCNTTPVLSAISGPTGVQAGVSNTWTVTSSATNNSYVTLQASWGDGIATVNSDSQQSYSYGSQTFSFSHVYQTPGTYTLRITATTNSGYSTYATYLVTVSGSNIYYQPASYRSIPSISYPPASYRSGGWY